MSIDDTTDQAVPPAQPDMFGALLELLKLVNNAAAVESRITSLRAAQVAAERATEKLERTRARHEIDMQSRIRVAEEAEKAAAKRQVAATAAESKLESELETIREFHRSEARGRDARRYEPLGGGTGVRDWGEGGRWRDDAPRPRDDPHFDAARPSAASGETELEHVGPASSTLTRSVERPAPSVERARRSMRRGRPNV
jgi:hypothetical protein